MSVKYLRRFSVVALLLTLLLVQPPSSAEGESTAPAEPKIDYKALKSPIPYTEKSIKRGRTLYTRRCTECHGPDGRALIDVIADATDLTRPIMWLSGISEGEIFRSIKEGAGVSMPPFKMQIKRDEDMWHMVNFIRSLWPKDKRPEVQEEVNESTDDEAKSSDKGEGK